jgi:hypothetical protein
MVLLYVVLFGVVAFLALGERRYGAAWAWNRICWAFLLMMGSLPFIGLLGALTTVPRDSWVVVAMCLMMASSAAAVWCADRMRRSTPPRPPTPFSWDEYAKAAVLAVGMHLMLLWLHQYMLSLALGAGLLQLLPAGWPRVDPLVALLTFFFAQIGTAAAFGGLCQALQKDWRRTDQAPLLRNRQYVLLALPLAVAAVLSIAVGIAVEADGAIPPLLIGLLGWLAALGIRFKCTSLPPANPLVTLWTFIMRGGARALG